MATDWVLVMVSRACKDSSADAVSPNEFMMVARKDPQSENTARGLYPPRRPAASPMISLVKSEEPSALQSRMIDPVFATAVQEMSAPPAKKEGLDLTKAGIKGVDT